MSDWKHRRVDRPNHPAIGRVVAVKYLIFHTSDKAAAQEADACDANSYGPSPSRIVLVYDDGREAELSALGYETEGVELSVTKSPVAEDPRQEPE